MGIHIRLPGWPDPARDEALGDTAGDGELPNISFPHKPRISGISADVLSVRWASAASGARGSACAESIYAVAGGSYAHRLQAAWSMQPARIPRITAANSTRRAIGFPKK